MCISRPIKVTTQEDIPQYGYKIMDRTEDGILETPYWDQHLKLGKWEQPGSKKIAHDIKRGAMDTSYLHHGRFSVFMNKWDAKELMDSLYNEVWLVEIKSRTIFIGTWNGKGVMLVNSIKLVRCVAKHSVWRRFKAWW